MVDDKLNVRLLKKLSRISFQDVSETHFPKISQLSCCDSLSSESASSFEYKYPEAKAAVPGEIKKVYFKQNS